MSGNSDTTTMSTSLPNWIQKEGAAPDATFASDYLIGARNLAQSPFTPYTQPRVAGWNPNYDAAIGRINATNAGSPELTQARVATGDIAGGFMRNSPWLSQDRTSAVIGDTADQMARTFARGTAAQTDAALNRQGAFGGSGWNEQSAANAGELARATGAMANQYQLGTQQMGAQDWRQGVEQQLGAAQMADRLRAGDLGVAKALGGAGDMQRGYQQEQLDALWQEFQRQQGFGYQQSNFLGNAIANAAGGQSTSTQTQPGQSLWGNLLGAGLVGGSLWNSWNK